jgi:hypothetical protein
MNRGSFCLLLVGLGLAGCRTQPYVNAHIESVNAEYRELEDYVYCLEDENARLQQEIDAFKRGVVSPGDTRSSSGTGGGIFRRRTPESTPSGDLAPPRIEATPAPEVPLIEVPGSGASPLPPPAGRSMLSPPADEQPASATEPAEAEAIAASPTDTKITHLFLNPLLTGGADFDGQPGDEGLSVVVEPRNAGDEYVPQAGAVSVVVLDPTRQGDAARVARWDFDLSATRQMLAAASPARGIKLELPWPAAAPANTHLKVFVRYETADGRRLQTDREIHLTPPGEASPGWTPRPGAPLASVAAEPAADVPSLSESKAPQAAASPRLAAVQPALLPPAALSAEARPKPARPVWSPNR